MNRSGRLPRGRPLRSRSKKRTQQNREEAECKQVLIARSGGWCEACPVLNRAGIVCADSSQPVRDQVFRAHLGRDKHEIKSRARGGSPTDPANCILVCRCAHDWIENHDREAVELGLSAHSWS